MTSFRQLPGLPTYGPLAVGFPANWARLGREGLVVEFAIEDGTAWIGNFCPGLGGLDAVRLHPDGTLVLVISSGALWCVDPLARSAEEISSAVLGMWELESGELLLDCQGIALIRLGRTGVAWRTHRISWDGFQSIRVTEESVTGEAWSPIENRWLPFSVDLASGQVEGGSYHEPEMHCGDPPSR